jgi:large subunit ribosomal protein L13
MKTYLMKTEEVKRDWHLIDAKGKIVGRLATEVSMLLMGKNKPTYTPHTDMGSYVVLLNSEKVKF